MKPDLIRLIIILLIAGSGLIRWVFVKLQEQAAKKRVADELERRRAEAFRTGRNLEEASAPDPVTVRAQAEAQAAARRQAQIDEFRRRQQERARQRTEAQRSAAPVASTPAQRPASPKVAPSPRPAAPSAASQRRPRKPLLAAAPEPEATPSPITRPGPTQTAARAALGAPQTPEQWRRVIVMNALLSPAPGLGEGGDPWSPVA